MLCCSSRCVIYRLLYPLVTLESQHILTKSNPMNSSYKQHIPQIPNGTGCSNYADPAQTLTGGGSFTASCTIQFRRAILTLIPSVIGAGILVLHSIATANRYRVIRLVDARRKLELQEPFQQDDKRVVGPHSAFAQEGCLPCWTCPNLDNDSGRVSHPTAASHGAYCCDDLHIEQRVYNPEGSDQCQAPPSMMTNVQPNAPIYISPPQQQQPLAPHGTLSPQYPTNMGAPQMMNPSGGIMLAPLVPQSGPVKNPAAVFFT